MSKLTRHRMIKERLVQLILEYQNKPNYPGKNGEEELADAILNEMKDEKTLIEEFEQYVSETTGYEAWWMSSIIDEFFQAKTSQELNKGWNSLRDSKLDNPIGKVQLDEDRL